MTTSYIREAQKELKAQKALAREAEALALSEEEAENNERIARKLARIAGKPVAEPEPEPQSDPEPEAEEAVEEKPKVKAAPKKKKPAKKKSS